MASPFPGMDPYLEGYLWPDVHNALANKIRRMLTPLLRPRYTARLDIYLAEDPNPEGEIGILYPDVEVLKSASTSDRPVSTSRSETLTMTPPGLMLPVTQPVSVRLSTVEIRDVAQNRLITSIEILSPVNKREPGLTAYRQKRQRLYEANVHLLEIDLLRRGARPFAQPRLPKSAYCVALTTAQSKQIALWPIALQDTLPVVPVPLKEPDEDVPLDLPSALADIYEEAAYDLSVDYRRSPPPPSLSAIDAKWLRTQIEQFDKA
ncbi:MAG: DUF4058 family protein [Cyanobacteria bacterium P01_D01_bin.44]